MAHAVPLGFGALRDEIPVVDEERHQRTRQMLSLGRRRRDESPDPPALSPRPEIELLHRAALTAEGYILALGIQPAEHEALARGLRRTPAWKARTWKEWWLLAREPWNTWWQLKRSGTSPDELIDSWDVWLEQRYPTGPN